MHATSQLRPYKAVFYAAYGFGPYECFFCREATVPFRGGRDSGGLHVHHINGDKDNNHPYNLAPAHNSCHRRWHVLTDGMPNRHRNKPGEFGNWNREKGAVTLNRVYRETIRWAFSHAGN